MILKVKDKIEQLIHSFHIPVMGTAFTIDTPIKVARYGISSVISLCDDELCENVRQYYCELLNKPYTEIHKKTEDCRAKRFTAYLNLVHDIVEDQFAVLKQAPFHTDSDITKYFDIISINK